MAPAQFSCNTAMTPARAAGSAVVERLDIAHPIIQGPFGGGLSTVQLTATVSDLGGLGSFGAQSLTPSEIGAVAADIRGLTTKPFAMNLWLSTFDDGGQRLDEATFERAWPVFEPYYRELGIDKPDRGDYTDVAFPDEQIDALLEARPAVFSFVYGIPAPKVLAECARRDIVTVGAATSIAEAQALEAAGVDMIVATGAEAGGHRPSFLAAAEESLIGTFALVQLISRRVTVPVIAAGGIADGPGMRAAFALGASAVQIGTAFLACAESGASDGHRSVLFSERSHSTALTRGFTGRLARGVRNRLTDELAAHHDDLPPFPITHWFASRLKLGIDSDARSDLIALWSGQIAPNLTHRNAAPLMHALIEDLTPRQ